MTTEARTFMRFEPKIYTVRELLQKVRSGDIVLGLPSFQRYYVWDNEDIKSLIDSMIKGLPIGVITLWCPERHGVDPFAIWIDFERTNDAVEGTRYLIIDGQQRLISLFLLASGWKLKVGPVVYERLPISLSDRRRLEIGARRGADLAEALRVRLGWSGDEEVLRRRYRHFDQLMMAVDRILDYELSVHVVETSNETAQTLADMAELFIRANRAGQRISNVELMLSYVAGVLSPEISKIVKEWYDKLQARWTSLDVQSVIRFGFGVGLDLKQKQIDQVERFREAVRELKGQRDIFGGSILEEELKRTLPYLETAIEAVDYLIGKAAVDLLPSKLSLVTLAAWMRKADVRTPSDAERERDRIISWLLLVNFHGYYSSSTSTRLQKDIDVMRDVESGGGFPFEELLDNIKSYRRGATAIELEDLERGLTSDLTKRPGSSYLFLLYCALCLSEAGDWQGIKIATARLKDLHKHHIFPKKLFSTLIEDGEEGSMVSGLGNITLINPSLNESIDTPPVDYIPKLGLDENELSRHFIPLRRDLWSMENFEDFCEERVRKLHNFLRGRLPLISSEK